MLVWTWSKELLSVDISTGIVCIVCVYRWQRKQPLSALNEANSNPEGSILSPSAQVLQAPQRWMNTQFRIGLWVFKDREMGKCSKGVKSREGQEQLHWWGVNVRQYWVFDWFKVCPSRNTQRLDCFPVREVHDGGKARLNGCYTQAQIVGGEVSWHRNPERLSSLGLGTGQLKHNLLCSRTYVCIKFGQDGAPKLVGLWRRGATVMPCSATAFLLLNGPWGARSSAWPHLLQGKVLPSS